MQEGADDAIRRYIARRQNLLQDHPHLRGRHRRLINAT